LFTQLSKKLRRDRLEHFSKYLLSGKIALLLSASRHGEGLQKTATLKMQAAKKVEEKSKS